MGIIRFADAEQGLEGIVPRNDETSNICKELTTDIEEDEGEVGCDQSEEGIDLRNRGLLLEVVQSGILGKLVAEDVSFQFHQVLESFRKLSEAMQGRCDGDRVLTSLSIWAMWPWALSWKEDMIAGCDRTVEVSLEFQGGCIELSLTCMSFVVCCELKVNDFQLCDVES